MAEKPPSEPMRAKAPAGPKVSGARTVVSLGLLVIVLIVCVIEVRAGLGQYLTLKSFAGKSENSMFQNVTLAEAQAMISMFPSSPVVTKGEAEDSYHYRWYSLLRPLAGKDVPELYVSADHSDPPRAVSFYTSIEGEPVHPPFDPNAVRTSTTLPGMPMGAGGPGGPRGGGMGGPGGPGGGGAGGPGGPGDGGRNDLRSKVMQLSPPRRKILQQRNLRSPKTMQRQRQRSPAIRQKKTQHPKTKRPMLLRSQSESLIKPSQNRASACAGD